MGLLGAGLPTELPSTGGGNILMHAPPPQPPYQHQTQQHRFSLNPNLQFLPLKSQALNPKAINPEACIVN